VKRVLALVRRLAGVPGVRRLTASPLLLRASYALRGSLVTERRRFARNELRGRAVTGRYHLRGTPVAIAIRHHTPDVMVLDELFAQGEYEPPAAVQPALRRLGADPLVADLGANIGLFGAWALERFPGARIVAFEPDPANVAVQELARSANGAQERWRIVAAFAGVRDGTVPFHGGSFTTSSALAGAATMEVPAVDVFGELGDADLVKVDIEGAEWPILADARLAELPASVLVVEYHPDGCPAGDARAHALALLEHAGYSTAEGGRTAEHDTGVVWAWRP
jgi:FkbM family methyltransferase